MRMIRNIMHDERGQAVTEFAVILPILLLVLFAIFQFGVIFNNYIEIAAAAREGARKGAVSRTAGNCAQVTSMVQASAQGAAPDLTLPTSQIAVADTCTNNQVQAGNDITVTVTYPWSVSLLGQVVASGNLSSATTMRVE
jgi:Flp pilus assembly protein TadG